MPCFISIITVCYNSSGHIQKAIESVLNQSFKEIEYIIVDGKSIDNTVDIIKKYEPRFNGRMKWISEPDNGIYDAINKGIRIATGEIIGILNSDDQFYDSQSVEKIAECFRDPGVEAVYGNLIITNNQNRLIRNWKSKPFRPGLFAKSWTPAHPTFYCHRSLYNKYGLYKTDYHIAADVELMLRFLEVYRINTYYLNETLVNMRLGGASTKGIKSSIIITKEVMRAFKENGLRFDLIKYMFYKGLKIKEYWHLF